MNHYERLYLILRPAQGNASGHARLEQRGNRAQMTLFVHGLQGRCRLRCLIFSQLQDREAVVDLGTLDTNDRGEGSMTQTGILLPGAATLSACDALAICLDWPHNQLILAAPIQKGMQPSRWTLQAAIDRYLNVPVQTPDPQQAALPLAAEEVPPPPPQPQPESRSHPPVDALQPLYWPKALEELKIYFDTLPPCAPFDAPGWRFVRAPLPHGSPARECCIGIRPLNGRIVQTAYALPAPEGQPPAALQGYQYESGKHEKGYWVLRQSH